MKKIIATIVAFVFSTSAYAVDLSSFSVGATLNHGIYGANGKEVNFDHLGAVGKTTKKDGAAFVDSYATLFFELDMVWLKLKVVSEYNSLILKSC